jgi:hypothetical protein
MQEFQMFQVIAKNAQDSGLYAGVGQQAKIFMILLAARELGIPPMLALNGGIWNIQGKIEISARLMSSLIRRAGHKLEIKSTDKFCTIRGIRKDTGEDHEETFTWAMAEKAGLTQGNVWKKYPEDMLYNRCISRIGRRLFADVIGTAYVEGELSGTNEKPLQQADCEEVSQKAPIKCEKIEHIEQKTCEKITHKAEEPIQMPRITEEELQNFLNLKTQIDEKCKDNMERYLKTFNIDNNNLNTMQTGLYQSCVIAMKNNISLNKEKTNENIAV